MFNTTTLPATPGLARRFLNIIQSSGIAFNAELAELAQRDLVDPSDLATTPWKMDAAMMEALQHVMDWQGRAVLLESGNDRARSIALASAYLRGGKTLIMAQPQTYAYWANAVREGWPDAEICVFGNPRYAQKDAEYPKGVEFSDRPNTDADFMITSYGGVIWHDLVGNLDVNQTIVEELDHAGSINYKWNDALNGMFHEIPSPLFIQNIHNLPSDQGRNNLASLQINGSKALQFLGQVVHHFMWAGSAVTRPLVAGTIRDVEEYLGFHGYKNMDILRLLSFYGVSSHLIGDQQGSKSDLTFTDNTVHSLKSQRQQRRDSGLLRLIDQEAALERQQGQTMEELVRHALDGDTVTQTLVGALKTHQWANLKAQHLKLIHTNLATKNTRSLFLVDNVDLKRNLKLHFSPVIDEFTAGSALLMTNRFLHPHAMLPGLNWTQMHNIKTLPNLIVTIDDLIGNPVLLDHANLLFMPEWPLDRDTYQAIRAAAEASGTRMVLSVLNGTFEEKIRPLLR